MKRDIRRTTLWSSFFLVIAALLVSIATGPAVGAPSDYGTPSDSNPPLPGAETQTKKDSSEMFKELDKNSDGQISKTEAKRSADTQSRFEELDADHSGEVSLKEWQEGMREKK